jgi:hypothetical protein
MNAIAGAISRASGRTVDTDTLWVVALSGTGLIFALLFAVNGLQLDYGLF